MRLDGDTGREGGGRQPWPRTGLLTLPKCRRVLLKSSELQLCALSSAGKGWDGRAGMKFNRVESEVVYLGKDLAV